jgi:succinate dehydrogenase/fumarate reductase flavoprotein subunit
MAFADFEAQHAAGIADSPEAYLADMVAEAALQQERYAVIFDTDLAGLYAKQSADAYRFLVDLGFRFGRFVPRPRQHTIDRMMDVADVAMFGRLFAVALNEAGVEVRHGVRARRLATRRGRVTGVTVEPYGGAGGGNTAVIEATGGVVLAAGGYQANHALRSRYQPGYMASTPYLGVDSDQGDGHLMGQAVGGDLINMTMIPPLVMVASALVEDSIAVDLSGRRFGDEAGPYDERVAALEATGDRRAFYIFDDRIHRARRDLVDQMPEPAVSAPTAGELATLIGCPPSALAASIDEWNATVTSGTSRDPAFGRVVFSASRAGITQPPLWASPMVVGVNFPAGGFRVSLDCEVIDVFGDVIPGLFAVGDCVGGIAPAIGLGGVKISSAVTLGRIAGRVAAGGQRNAAASPPSGQAPGASAIPAGKARGLPSVTGGPRIPIVG